MATARKRWTSWLTRHSQYLNVVMTISDPVTAGRGSEELRFYACQAVKSCDEWAGVIPTPYPLDVRDETFAVFVAEIARCAEREWPKPQGYPDWAAAFGELVQRACEAHT
jgi:hypothetical protein